MMSIFNLSKRHLAVFACTMAMAFVSQGSLAGKPHDKVLVTGQSNFGIDTLYVANAEQAKGNKVNGKIIQVFDAYGYHFRLQAKPVCMSVVGDQAYVVGQVTEHRNMDLFFEFDPTGYTMVMGVNGDAVSDFVVLYTEGDDGSFVIGLSPEERCAVIEEEIAADPNTIADFVAEYPITHLNGVIKLVDGN